MILKKYNDTVDNAVSLIDENDFWIADCGAWKNAEAQRCADEILTAVNERPALLARIAELEAALKEARYEIKFQYTMRINYPDFESAGEHNEVVKKIEALLDGDK